MVVLNEGAVPLFVDMINSTDADNQEQVYFGYFISNVRLFGRLETLRETVLLLGILF